MSAQPDLLCVIDMGSNSIKVSLWRVVDGPQWLMSRRFPVRLGKSVFKTGLVDSSRIDATVDALAEVRMLAEREGTPVYRAVATAAVRAADNRDELLRAVQAKTGIEVEVATEDREARLTAEGMLWTLHPEGRGCYAVIDIGGGSGEITTLEAEGTRIVSLESRSLLLGAVKLTEQFLHSDPPEPEEISSLRAHIDDLLVEIEPFDGTVVGCGGTMVTLGWMLRGKAERTPHIDLSEMEALLDQMTHLTVEQRCAQFPLEPQRAEIIVAGAIALIETMRALGADSILVSQGGNREGLLVEHLQAR